MDAARFILDFEKGDAFNWGYLRTALQRGRSVILRGYTLGNGTDDERFLGRFAGATFEGRVRFEKCIFTKHLDWSEATFKQTLHMVECEIREGICLMDAVVKGRCSFRGSTFTDKTRHWLNWRGLKTGRGLHLIDVTAHAPIDLYQAVVGGDLHLSGIHVTSVGLPAEDVVRRGRLSEIQTHHVAGEMPGISLNLDGARISGNLFLNPFSRFKKNKQTGVVENCWTSLPYLEGSLNLSSRIGGTVMLDHAMIGRDELGRSLIMQRAAVDGSVIIVRGTVLLGQADLRAKVTRQVTLEQATVIRGAHGVAVEMNAAKIGDAVSFRGGTTILGSLDLRAEIGGQIALEDTQVLHRRHTTAVLLAEASVGGSFILCKGTEVLGGVDLRATIRGQVRFNGVSIDAGAGATAINMDEARVEGPVLFKDGTYIVGGLDLRARFGGQLAFANTVVDPGKPGKAITLEGARIQGPMLLGENTLIGGDLVLLHTKLHGGLQAARDYRRRDFDRPGTVEPKYPAHRRCVILGDVECTGAQSGASMLFHEVSLMGRVIGAHLSIAGNLHICGGVTGKTDALRAMQARHWLNSLTAGTARLRASHSTTSFGEYSVVIYAGPPLDHMGAPCNLPGWTGWLLGAPCNLPGSPSWLLGASCNLASLTGWLPWDLLSTPRSVSEPAIHLELADIQGNLLINGQRVLGIVNAQLCHVKGDVSLGRSLVEGDLLLQDAKIEGAFGGKLAESREADPLVRGVIDARGATMASATIVLGDGTGTNAHAADDYLLDNATVGTLRIEGGSLETECRRSREGNSRWSLHRLGFDEIEVPSDQGGQRRWPILSLLQAARFSAALHIDVERWARAAGDDPIADEVFLMRRRRELCERRPELDDNGRPERRGKPAHYSWTHKKLRWLLYDVTIGYGVRWQRALCAIVILWLLNWAVFLPHTAMESTTNAREPHSREQATAPASHEWGPQRAFFMATRLQVPFVELFIDAEWKPADRVMFDRDGDGGLPWLTYENYAAIMRILNLILVPVIIAGATGLLKPREAQYTGAS